MHCLWSLNKTLVELDDEYNCMLISGMDVHYRQGFSDAVHLMMETLTWAPTRGKDKLTV